MMTMEFPTVSPAQPTSNPRKRKKRAPAAGAAVDCFACADRKIRCDRRRPYCSQCLDAGQDCSGYKTQLTWGVGVASRGKLRGLSLPVAGPQKVAANESQPKPKRQKETTNNLSHGLRNVIESPQEERNTVYPDRYPVQEQYHLTSKSSRSIESTDRSTETRSTLASQSEMSPNTSHSIAQHCQIDATFISQSMLDPNIHALSDGQLNSWTHLPPHTLSYSIPAYSTTGIATITAPSQTVGYLYSPDGFDHSPNILPSNTSHFAQQEDGIVHASPQSTSTDLTALTQGGQSISFHTGETMEEADEEVIRQHYTDCAVVDEANLFAISSPFDFSFPMPALSGMNNIGKTLRMQYLINYYTEVISPVIVAFDSPNNPFRAQILRLAMSSETLQHAISALSASNLRQRRGIGLLSTGKTAPARRSSMAHVHLIDEKWHAQGLLSPEEQMREETFHKRLAVSQLNQQLAHPVLRKDDSILATLLILCLFHICDSGVAKFQTQFAGVRKLLALRGDVTSFESENSKWMSRLFTWFDSLAATVNDREGQLGGRLLDMSELCGDWALENMAGVDGRLCKIISKLGRLNVLRQGQPVESDILSTFGPVQATPSNLDFYRSFDGNGWMQHGEGSDDVSTGNDDQFWKEWKVVQNELLSWSLNTELFDSISKEAAYLTVDQRIDMNNISESFRYAALIYIERLARPQIPSSDETMQQWVRHSLHYIRQVQSDVHLLWPLFITGTECIDDVGRSVIRGRCADIQKDSGFVNNASCLELLEKVWRADAHGLSPRSDEDSPSTQDGQGKRYGSSFMFRQVMVRESANGADGEYLVV